MKVTGSARKGITPVVAIVMLLMLTIVVAGGAFAFLTGFFENQQQDIQEQQNTEAEFRSIECTTPDTIDFLVKNTGDTNIDMSAVDVYVYRISNNTLVGSPISTSRANDLTVNDRHWSATETLTSGSFTSGRTYRVEIEFTSNDGPTLRTECDA